MRTILLTALAIYAVTTATGTTPDQQSASQPTKAAETSQAEVIPEIKGIKLGATLSEVMMLVFGETVNNTSRAPSRVNDLGAYGAYYIVSVDMLSRITSIAGNANYDMSLRFVKAETKGSSILFSISVRILQVDDLVSDDSLLKGLTEKYGKPTVSENATFTWSFGGRYTVVIKKLGSNTLLLLTDEQINTKMVEEVERMRIEKNNKAAKDI